MNHKKIVEMNHKFKKGADTMTQIKGQKKSKKLIKSKTKSINKEGDNMTIKTFLERVKKKVQNDTTSYIMGVKFVTLEDSETVIQTIKKDFMIYPNITRIVVKDNLIKLMLDNNATLYTFYFLKQDVFKEVVHNLDQFDVEVLKL